MKLLVYHPETILAQTFLDIWKPFLVKADLLEAAAASDERYLLLVLYCSAALTRKIGQRCLTMLEQARGKGIPHYTLDLCQAVARAALNTDRLHWFFFCQLGQLRRTMTQSDLGSCAMQLSGLKDLMPEEAPQDDETDRLRRALEERNIAR